MIHDAISKIEPQIRRSEAVPPQSKAELLAPRATLKPEMAESARTQGDQAQSIAGFTAVSTHEATREEPDPQLLKLSLEGLSSSVQGFEESHPRLVQIVNAISTTLANLGI